jgi:1-deoxy-D-xylulose-5-phosphate reductoisomerase
MGLPDMRLPIQYALSYPDRLKSDFPRLNFSDYPTLTFEQPDLETFRNLALSYQALEKGGNLPCVLNAANEVAVDAFLKESIGFLDISSVIEESMGTIGFIENPILDDFVETDIETRIKAKEIISKWEVH